jgi:hypothetical protein
VTFVNYPLQNTIVDVATPDAMAVTVTEKGSQQSTTNVLELIQFSSLFAIPYKSEGWIETMPSFGLHLNVTPLESTP